MNIRVLPECFNPALTPPSLLRPGPGAGHVLLRPAAPAVPPGQSSGGVPQSGRQQPAAHPEHDPAEGGRGHGAAGRADGRP